MLSLRDGTNDDTEGDEEMDALRDCGCMCIIPGPGITPETGVIAPLTLPLCPAWAPAPAPSMDGRGTAGALAAAFIRLSNDEIGGREIWDCEREGIGTGSGAAAVAEFARSCISIELILIVRSDICEIVVCVIVGRGKV